MDQHKHFQFLGGLPTGMAQYHRLASKRPESKKKHKVLKKCIETKHITEISVATQYPDSVTSNIAEVSHPLPLSQPYLAKSNIARYPEPGFSAFLITVRNGQKLCTVVRSVGKD
jgi:hypothetical protein